MATAYNKKVGDFGEEMATKYLIKKGYKILGRNIKTSYKEIDIVAKENDILVFVEVKTRTSNKFGDASSALGHFKSGYLKRAVSIYLRNMGKQKEKEYFRDIRLDFIAVDVDRVKKMVKIRHYPDVG